MLILPLHRPLTRATFPLATAALVLLNLFVFFGLQAGDDAALERAQAYYVDAGLGRYEVPAYERHLRATVQPQALQALQQVPVAERPAYVAARTLSDAAFAEALHAGGLFDDPAALEAWRPLRDRYEAMQAQVFTLRHLLRSSEVDPWRMLASAFLHADVLHLVGNLVFLVAIGLLVEGALGPLRFLGVYLLGAFGSSAASLLWRWGEAGGGLGASGAIAALMGAFCVVWGRQPVRFFYWVGVVFDYVRAPAIWLLPLWLGWEVYNLLANPDLGIGFDAHAGGLVCGALTGAVLVWTGQVREDFIRDPAPADDYEQRWARAQQHLGRLELAEAGALLEALADERPDRADVRLARYRAARHGGRRELQRQRAAEWLATPARDAAAVQAQREVWLDLGGEDVGAMLAPAQQLAALRRWLLLGEPEAVEAVLAAAAPADAEVQAQLWFELALAYRDRLAGEAHLRALRALLQHHPQQPQAQKARFLLENA